MVGILLYIPPSHYFLHLCEDAETGVEVSRIVQLRRGENLMSVRLISMLNRRPGAHPQIDVQRAQGLDVGLGQLKRLNLEVLHKTLVAVALGNNCKTLLNGPAEQHLRRCCRSQLQIDQ